MEVGMKMGTAVSTGIVPGSWLNFTWSLLTEFLTRISRVFTSPKALDTAGGMFSGS
jgi:hypothetical protein